MRKFEIGMTVICINDKAGSISGVSISSSPLLRKGNKYTVTGIGKIECGCTVITIGVPRDENRKCCSLHKYLGASEVINNGEYEFAARRFIPEPEAFSEIEYVKQEDVVLSEN